MVTYPLQKIKSHEVLKYYLQRPSFLSIQHELKLLTFIKNNTLDDFYNFASKLVKNTSEIVHLYIYLMQ